MKFSDFDFLAPALSTSSRIREAVDCSNSFVVLTLISPLRLMHPLNILSPADISSGILSPVSALVLIVESPSKSKTIEKYLGKDYEVVSSKGHIRDLAIKGKDGLGIDIDKFNNILIQSVLGNINIMLFINLKKLYDKIVN